MRIYKGTRREKGVTSVTVDGDFLPSCVEHVDYSEEGFEWGYVGSGPKQLAFAILMKELGNVDVAQPLCESYMKEVISRIQKDTWKIVGSDVSAWIFDATLLFWQQDEKLFDVELDKWLREHDKNIGGYGVVEELYRNFIYFTQYKGVFGDDPVSQLWYWLSHANATTLYTGYSSEPWRTAPPETLEQSKYDFFREYINPNIVRRAKKELGVSSQELAGMIGYGHDAVSKAASIGMVSKPMTMAITLLLENHKLKEELEHFKTFKKSLTDFLNR